MKTFEEFGIHPKGTGGQWEYMSCPQCSRQRKKKQATCLSVNVEEGYWVCHHCGWKGSLKQGTKYVDPAWNKPEYIKPKLIKSKTDLPNSVLDFFRQRGIHTKTLKRNNIVFEEVYMPQVEKHVNAIGFPYYRGEEHVNTKWRDNAKNFRQETGAQQILYGLNDIKDENTVIWVEGEMDKLSLEEAGIKNCVSCPNGAPDPKSKTFCSKFDFLLEVDDYILNKRHILFVDADEAGVILENELGRRLGKENCKRVRLPEGLKDANELLVNFGIESVKEAVNDAQAFPVSGIHTGKELTHSVIELNKHGLKSGVRTGWFPVDVLFRPRTGEFTVITGIPNHGKSNWLDCLALNIASQEGWRFGVFSPENQPLSRHAASLVEKKLKMPFNKISPEDIEACMGWLDKHFYWILPELDETWSLQTILDKARTLILRHGIKALIIDPWNQLEHLRPTNLNETEYIGKCLTEIRRFCRLYDIHIFIVAHPAKLYKEKGEKDYPVPTLYSISGSANWRNIPDNGIAVYRHAPFSNGMTPDFGVDIHVQKVRFKENGTIGMAELRYDPNDCNYYEKSSFNV